MGGQQRELNFPKKRINRYPEAMINCIEKIPECLEEFIINI